MSFRTSKAGCEVGREEKPYKTSMVRSAGRLRSLTIVRDDISLKLICSAFVFFLLASCGGKTPATNTDPASSITNTSAPSNKKNILFFGDSLTAGYGLTDPSDEAYPAVVQHKIDSLKLNYNVINAGVSGETTAGGLGRIDWALKRKVDVFILELGANDGLRGIPVEETRRNLQAIINKVKAKYPNAKIILAGMQVPPSMGADYCTSFKATFPQIAQKNNISLIPFLLDNVAGIPKLNQNDGIHPTAQGAKIVANNVWLVLKPEL
ncbi:MAG TPA: arylesterase [Mucilaginibacter sp.]|jgi:acyl-CoA thioesterase-1|nr:arylesterase [Mucilaginibacter sp.]